MIASIVGISTVAFIAWALCFKMISPGYVGVVVDLMGDSKGVEAKELHVGMQMNPINEFIVKAEDFKKDPKYQTMPPELRDFFNEEIGKFKMFLELNKFEEEKDEN